MRVLQILLIQCSAAGWVHYAVIGAQDVWRCYGTKLTFSHTAREYAAVNVEQLERMSLCFAWYEGRDPQNMHVSRRTCS